MSLISDYGTSQCDHRYEKYTIHLCSLLSLKNSIIGQLHDNLRHQGLWYSNTSVTAAGVDILSIARASSESIGRACGSMFESDLIAASSPSSDLNPEDGRARLSRRPDLCNESRGCPGQAGGFNALIPRATWSAVCAGSGPEMARLFSTHIPGTGAMSRTCLYFYLGAPQPVSSRISDPYRGGNLLHPWNAVSSSNSKSNRPSWPIILALADSLGLQPDGTTSVGRTRV